ncbi:N-acetylneuraminate synthase [Sediminibacterium sp. KACHI17]|uniref:N-acetylneuraminate synthase n=1 Tax=Sediminibacterium sp. KACHI17 TaxID=1751071 RepID=A0AAT9GIH3_9BACT
MKKTLIIAEAGVNHNGSYEFAKKLIEIAADAGADFVKFQTFKADKIVNKSAKKADYQIANTNEHDDSQYAMLKDLEMPSQWYPNLIEYSKAKGISFLSTGFDEDSIDFLDELGIPFFKIPSGEITNRLYLQHIALKKKPVIISTGMASMEEIEDALKIFYEAGYPKKDITVLHCNTEYPTPFSDVNLLAMKNIRELLEVRVGYSDHTEGIEVPIAAVALGAEVIEKHFTIDKSMPGPDHKASLEPVELKNMVSAIRNIEQAMAGSGNKEPSVSEKKNIKVIRKSLHFSKSLTKGSVISKNDLVALRPGDGISPMKIDDVIGKTLQQDVKAFQLVDLIFFQ